MADPRGIIKAKFGGKSYTLEMNWGVLGDLEEEYGDKFHAMINGTGGVPIAFMTRAVCLSLIEADPELDAKEARFLSRKMTDQKLFAQLIAATFPDAEIEEGTAGNEQGPKRAA